MIFEWTRYLYLAKVLVIRIAELYMYCVREKFGRKKHVYHCCFDHVHHFISSQGTKNQSSLLHDHMIAVGKVSLYPAGVHKKILFRNFSEPTVQNIPSALQNFNRVYYRTDINAVCKCRLEASTRLFINKSP